MRRRSRPTGERERRRGYSPAGYGADYLHNLRWRYRTGYGSGRDVDPYRSGGSFGRGYERAADLGARSAEPGPPPQAERRPPYYGRHPGGYRGESRRRRPGTAARDYGRGYPYFGSAAVVEAAQGYPPGSTLRPEISPPPFGWGTEEYGEEYAMRRGASDRERRGEPYRAHSEHHRGRSHEHHRGRGREHHSGHRHGHHRGDGHEHHRGHGHRRGSDR